MDKLLQQHPLCNYTSYREFIRDLCKDGFSQGFTFEQLNYELYDSNKKIYQELTRELLDIAQRQLDTHVHPSRQKLTR